MHPTRTAIALLALTLASCSGFTEVESDGGGNGEGDAYKPGGTGPGPYGVLPSGYCCTKDEQCRFRTCMAISGGKKMCSDWCATDKAGCGAPASGLKCDTKQHRCVPTSASYTCTPADQFTYGSKKMGACCTATHDFRAGFECEGGHCGAFGPVTNPYICLNVCDEPSDCPGHYSCGTSSKGYGICVPEAKTYTCK
jgi:hypothetical protein